MTEVSEARRKLLTEYLDEKPGLVCRRGKCDKYRECWEGCEYVTVVYRRSFTTIEDFYALKCKMVEKGEFEEFMTWVYEIWRNTEYHNITYSSFDDWLINPARCETVAEWRESLKGRNV
jgi:hypothetical protein